MVFVSINLKHTAALKERDVTDIAVFVARHYGGVHLGKRRFEIYEQMASKAVQAWYSKIAKKTKRVERMNSQDSFTSLASVLSDNEQETETKTTTS